MDWTLSYKSLFLLVALIGLVYGLKYFYQMPKYNNGERAIDFSAILQSGENFKLSDLRGQYILLDFWASWCGPCRKENPGLVSLNNEMQNKSFETAGGFKIVSVGLEAKRGNWEKAIIQDSLYWKYQIGEFEQFSGPIANLYRVREIPTKYFISPDGLILLTNPTISEVQSYLEEKITN